LTKHKNRVVKNALKTPRDEAVFASMKRASRKDSKYRDAPCLKFNLLIFFS